MQDNVKTKLDSAGETIFTLSLAAVILTGLYAAVHYHSVLAVLIACSVTAIASIAILAVVMFIVGFISVIREDNSVKDSSNDGEATINQDSKGE